MSMVSGFIDMSAHGAVRHYGEEGGADDKGGTPEKSKVHFHFEVALALECAGLCGEGSFIEFVAWSVASIERWARISAIQGRGRVSEG